MCIGLNMTDDDDLVVTISGPALSMLLYENARCPGGDQIGFLLGEILIYVTKKVTDSERDVEDVKKNINIKSVVAYPLGEPFFNTVAEINEDKLKHFLKENAKKVVGWYHYKKEYRLVSTMRDRLLHNTLSSFFSKLNDLQIKETFIFCILTSQVSKGGGTHKFKHILFREESSILKAVPLNINNLGADATRPDGTDYKPKPKYSSNHSDAFDQVYRVVKDDLKSTHDNVQTVTLIQKAAENFLDWLIPQVAKTDKEVSDLEKKLTELRDKWFHENYERIQLTNSMRKMEVDSKSDISEPKSPESPSIFDSPKKKKTDSMLERQFQSTSSQKVLNPVSKQYLKQISSGGDRKRDSISSERDLGLTICNSASPKSPQSENLRVSPVLSSTRNHNRGRSSSSKQLTPQPCVSQRRQSPDRDNYNS